MAGIMGTYRPDGGLAAFDQTAATADGTWTMDVKDVAWAIKRGANMPGFWRFEVRQGDEPPGDVGRGRDRAELSASATKLANSRDLYMAMSQRVLTPSAPLSVTTTTIGQLHATDDAGDAASNQLLEHRLSSNAAQRFRIIGSGSTVNPTVTPTNTTVFTDAAFEYDVWYDYVYHANLHWTNGVLEVWRRKQGETAFTKIVDLTGLCLGYDDIVGPYWKFGIYRNTAAETLKVDYCNVVAFGYGSTLNRLNFPWPHPA